MTAGSSRASTLIKALPLVVIDIAATYVAYLVGSWGTQVFDIVMDIAFLPLYVSFLALVNVLVFAFMRMYTTLWVYASIDELTRVVIATIAASVLGDLLAVLVFGQRLPFRVYICAWAILLVVCGASRFAIRIYSGKKGWTVFGVHSISGLPLSLVIGAGETGSLTVKRMLANSPDMPGNPMGLVDDDATKVGRYVHGVKVLGTCDDIPRICKTKRVDQIVIATPSATRAERERIYDLCIKTGIKTLTLPFIKDMPQDVNAKIPLREVEISDLLARDEVALDLGQMGYVTGKRVLVTGGGGSIGSELVRQLLPAKPSCIVLFDIYENTTYELYHEIAASAERAGTKIHVEIGSITHVPALEKVFDEYEPQVVFHAAAHKHVPLMENNPREAIENNVFGTVNLIRLAHERACTHFVLISTDKAVNPTNVMGATKRMGEMIVQYYASISDTVFTSVRFGNVLGSHGSVIPLFRRQLEHGGPITVTHKDITRYFMTIPEASRLVITAGALAADGEIFVLNMGEPVRIYDLAENLVRLSGLRPGRDIEIAVTGLRPGEKMHEELLMDAERTVPTENKDIMVSVADSLDLGTVSGKLERLEECLELGNDDIKRVLAEVVPTYHPDFGA